MGTKWISDNVFDNGLADIIADIAADNVDFLVITKYTSGDSYATVAAEKVATVNLTGSDAVLGSHADGRQIAFGATSATATSSSVGGADIQVACVNVTSSAVLFVTDASDQVITSGNTINLSSFLLKFSHPA
jgi:hypothetical protein